MNPRAALLDGPSQYRIMYLGLDDCRDREPKDMETETAAERTGATAGTAAELSFGKQWQTRVLLKGKAFRRALRAAWKAKFGPTCPDCGCEMAFDQEQRQARNYATIDHILAEVLGGTSLLSNIRLVCFVCNSHKGGREAKAALAARRQRRADEAARKASGGRSMEPAAAASGTAFLRPSCSP